MEFKKIILPYELDALEPYISKQTMDLHYNKHHTAYEKGLNTVLADLTDIPSQIKINDLKSLMTNYFHIKDRRAAVQIRRMGGGLINHDFFFMMLKQGTVLTENMPFYKALIEHFGSFGEFKEIFVRHAKQVFGSGWAWLAVNKQGKFKILHTANQDNPWMVKHVVAPLIGIDVWEHSYYIDYQNRRNDYIDAFFNVINWDKVNELFIKIKAGITEAPVQSEDLIKKF